MYLFASVICNGNYNFTRWHRIPDWSMYYLYLERRTNFLMCSCAAVFQSNQARGFRITKFH